MAVLTAIATALRPMPGGTRWEPGLTVGSGVAVRRVFSDLVGRERPPEQWWQADPVGPSFPSRHTAWTTLAVASLVDAVPTGAGPVCAVTQWTLVAGVGLSRLRLGVHWPSDVLAGALFGVTWQRLTTFALHRATGACLRSQHSHITKAAKTRPPR